MPEKPYPSQQDILQPHPPTAFLQSSVEASFMLSPINQMFTAQFQLNSNCLIDFDWVWQSHTEKIAKANAIKVQ